MQCIKDSVISLSPKNIIMKKLLSILIIFTCSFQVSSAQDMNNDQLQKIFEVFSDTLAGSSGRWEMLVGEVPMYCLTDTNHNRMRIISPIKKVEDASKEEILKCLEANFHTALDVKYSISEDIIWVAFIHPLKELSMSQVIDALSQVWAGALTYGTTYTSTNLTFPNQEEKEKEVNKKKKDAKRS